MEDVVVVVSEHEDTVEEENAAEVQADPRSWSVQGLSLRDSVCSSRTVQTYTPSPLRAEVVRPRGRAGTPSAGSAPGSPPRAQSWTRSSSLCRAPCTVSPQPYR